MQTAGRQFIPRDNNETNCRLLIYAAKAAGLSVPTIQKVISAMEILGTSQLTTQELASVLKVSVVNANRVLNSLAASGQAEVISVQKAISHGRPSRIYKITLLKKQERQRGGGSKK